MKSRIKLEEAVSAILESYKQHPDLERIGKKKLPAREDIIQLAKDIQMLLFPGFIREESLEPLELPYIIGQKTVSIFNRLCAYLDQVLCWEIAQNGENCRDDSSFGSQVEQIAMEFLESIPQLRNVLAEDIKAFYEGDPAARSQQEIVLGYPGVNAISIHRISHFFYEKNIPLLPRIISEYVHSQTGIDIHPGAKLGKGIMIDHGTGIVIGETSVIGDGVRIYQGVTIGALSPTRKVNRPKAKRHPTIEDHVVIYAGATILGGKTIVGKNSIIGGNVWLTHSVPSNSLVVWDAPANQRSVRREEIMLSPDPLLNSKNGLS
ncbi:MAG: serine acetyltransferase [SAR324 cluster bacterium]|nr:serine acetyltransferase [SAR324 cluster bacterium]